MFKMPREVAVVTSVAERHYGVAASVTYNEAKDFDQTLIWDKYDKVFRVITMDWFIVKVSDSA